MCIRDSKLINGGTRCVYIVYEQNALSGYFRHTPGPYAECAAYVLAPLLRPERPHDMRLPRSDQNIIIGTPVWWYTVPMPIYSFLDAYDLSGKNVMVFTTHEGSGLADAINVIRQQEPQASVNATGFQTRGASVGSQSDAINEWLNGLGYK